MQSQIISPTNTKSIITKKKINDQLVVGTTKGLVKQNNEDRLGYLINGDATRVCIADGHWGAEAAQIITKHWIELKRAFPSSKKTAIEETKLIEAKLFKTYGKSKMDPEKDFTPEASFVAVQIENDNISIVSYGDCRLLVTVADKISYKLKTLPTWLGAFSALGLRNRLAIESAVVFKNLNLQDRSTVVMFTDGVDECIYEKPTISPSRIARIAGKHSPETAFDLIMAEVLAKGAQDNASLALIKT